jgi:hypothetical protein
MGHRFRSAATQIQDRSVPDSGALGPQFRTQRDARAQGPRFKGPARSDPDSGEQRTRFRMAATHIQDRRGPTSGPSVPIQDDTVI